jgi:hypothetical protein
MIMFCTKRKEHNSGLIGIKYNVEFYILGVILLADWMDGNDKNVEHEHLRVWSDTESDVAVGDDNSVVV